MSIETSAPNSSSIIDLEVINAYLGPEDDIALISDLAEYFKKNAPIRLESARANYLSGNERQFKYYLHALKNSFLNIGALTAASECQELEDVADDLNQIEVEDRFKQLERIIASASKAVTDFISAKLK